MPVAVPTGQGTTILHTSVPRPPYGTSCSTQQPSTWKKPAAAGGKSTYFSSYQLSRASLSVLGRPRVCPAWPEHPASLKPERRGTSALGCPGLHRRALPPSWETLPTCQEHRAWCTSLHILYIDLPAAMSVKQIKALRRRADQ